MGIGQILRQLILGPIELLLDVIYSVALRKTGSAGWSIVVLSLLVNLLLLPLYKRADAMQKEERDRAVRMKPRLDQIREVFTGSERFMITQTYYRQNHYKPYYALKGSVSLLLQIPFFMAAYSFLSHLQVLHGVSFGPIRDLSTPDALLHIGGTTIHLLPILMTAINILSGMLYSRNMPLKSKIQMYGLALVFLVLLYNSPSGLVFYWTLNNVFSLLKNALARLSVFQERRNQASVKKIPQACGKQLKSLFYASCVFLALLTGILIPSEVIKSSTSEFLNIWHLEDPLRYLLSSGLLACGTFLIWCGIYYSLMGEKARRRFAFVFGIAGAAAVLNYTVFGIGYGDMSSLLQYGRPVQVSFAQGLLNALAIAVLIALISVLIRKKAGLVRAVYMASALALVVLSVMNMSAIRAEYREQQRYADNITEQSPVIHLSKTGKNVVVIMLDRAVGGFVPYMINEKPELAEQLEGFTYYPNTLSFGFHTNVGSPPLYGGYEYTPDGMAARPDERLVDKHNEALKVMPVLFLEKGYDVTVMDPSLANYEWIPDLSIYDDYPDIHRFNVEGYFTRNTADIEQYSDQIRNRNLFCYSIFRTAPLFMHTEMYNEGKYNETDTAAQALADPDDLTGVSPDFLQNYWVMENLNAMTEIRQDEQGCFLMLATEVTHDVTPLQEPEYVPKQHVDNSAYEEEYGIRLAADGSALDIGSGGEFLQTHYQCNMSAFLQLSRWFRYLRDEEVWDNTRIIIVSDHAYDMEVLGFDLADKYPGVSRESAVNGEVWTVTTAYQPVLLVKDFDSNTFSTDDTFMTNADTPVLAFRDIIEDPVNPFTGNAITSDAKFAGELHLIETDWHFENNNGNTFSDPQTITFRNQDIFNIDNWSIDDRKAEE